MVRMNPFGFCIRCDLGFRTFLGSVMLLLPVISVALVLEQILDLPSLVYSDRAGSGCVGSPKNRPFPRLWDRIAEWYPPRSTENDHSSIAHSPEMLTGWYLEESGSSIIERRRRLPINSLAQPADATLRPCFQNRQIHPRSPRCNCCSKPLNKADLEAEPLVRVRI